jgi:hypothetical protein
MHPTNDRDLCHTCANKNQNCYPFRNMSHKILAVAAMWFCLSLRAEEPGIRLVSPEGGAVFAEGESILLKAEARAERNWG